MDEQRKLKNIKIPVPKSSEWEEMKATSERLFPDRPAIVQEHHMTKFNCHCDHCDEYFQKGK